MRLLQDENLLWQNHIYNSPESPFRISQLTTYTHTYTHTHTHTPLITKNPPSVSLTLNLLPFFFFLPFFSLLMSIVMSLKQKWMQKSQTCFTLKEFAPIIFQITPRIKLENVKKRVFTFIFVQEHIHLICFTNLPYYHFFSLGSNVSVKMKIASTIFFHVLVVRKIYFFCSFTWKSFSDPFSPQN